MNTNVGCIEPNLAIFFKDGELKHYNLIYGQWQYEGHSSGSVSYITNMLLVKAADGGIIPPAYPTTIELQNQVASLDFAGEYFYSVQPINDTPFYPGWVINKWQISSSLYGLERIKFKLFPGLVTAQCLALEWYTFTLLEGVDPSKNYITVSTDFTYALSRITPNTRIKVGPNSNGDIFWGTVKTALPYPNNPYYTPWKWVITFEEDLNSSYVAGEDAFVETGLHIFDTGGALNLVHPEDFSLISRHEAGEYKNVTACAFTVVNNVPSINVGMKTPALFYVSGMEIYCKKIDDLSRNISAQSLPLNYYAKGNRTIPVYELRVRNDHPDSLSNYPQHYLLQKDYRETRDIDAGTESWDTYNYILKNLHSEPSYMAVDVEPQFLSQSGIAYCSCLILDDYNFPVSNAGVTWSHNCGSSAHFLDSITTHTNVSGYAYNRLFADQNLTFPAYVTATTDAI